MTGRLAQSRHRLPFSQVNRRSARDYDPGLQRHHLLPRELLGKPCLTTMLAAAGTEAIGFDDFRRNGLLLPANDRSALRMGLPLHRGPHRIYNALVIERVGQIEASWARTRLSRPDRALEEALMRLALLQRALRRRLLQANGHGLALNRFDPRGRMPDFTELDAMADALWSQTEASGNG